MLLWTAVMPIFAAMDVPDEVARRSAGYLAAVGFGMPGVAIFQSLRAFSDGMNHTRPALWISLVGLAVNVPSNYLLIYGGEGLTSLLGDGVPAPCRPFRRWAPRAAALPPPSPCGSWA